MKNIWRIILGITLFGMCADVAYASHLYGADITYSCVNSCTTRVYLRAYRNCTGLSVVWNNLTWRPAPGCVAPAAIGQWSPQVTTEITPICPTTATGCTVPGSPIGGIQEYYWFRDYNTCSVPACQYTLTYSDCCRNQAITGLASPGNTAFFVAATINTAISPCNNSPQFMVPPVMMITQGQTAETSVAAHDADGDQLVYRLTTCRSDSVNTVAYGLGYSANAPMGPSWTVSLDSLTGQLTLGATPGNIVVGVICVRVDEYRNGQQIGSVTRDFLVMVLANQGNGIPIISSVSNLTGNASVNGDEILMCNPTPICFDITTTDANLAQNMALIWSQNLPGATFTQVGNVNVQDTIYGMGANPPAGRFCWTPPGPGSYALTFGVTDGNCPVLGIANRAVLIRVGAGAPTATATPGPCPSVQFATAGCGLGAWTYQWTGAGGLNTTAQNPNHVYPGPGTYPWQVVVTDGTVSNTIVGTVAVSGAPAYQSMLGSGYFVAPCVGTVYDTIDAGSYAAYLWNTGATTRLISVSQAGFYSVSVTAANGCAYHDSTQVYSLPPDIEGHVVTSTNQPLQNQKIYLILHDTIAQALHALDSIQTDSNGYYYFCNVSDTLVFLKAAPLLADYPTQMPTYADTSLVWSNATTFYPLVQSPFIHDFATKFGVNPGGLGFIGGLISQGANKMSAIGDPVPGLRVLLRNHATGEVLAYRDTDANGRFSFANIPLGDYEIVPDRAPVSTTNVPLVSIDAQTPVRDSLTFSLHSTWLELEIPSVSVLPPLPGFAVAVVPNPFGHAADLQLRLDAATEVDVRVMDVMGRLVARMQPGPLDVGLHTMRIGEQLSAGTYFVQVRAGTSLSVLRVVKK
jgi:PKD repeat protein